VSDSERVSQLSTYRLFSAVLPLQAFVIHFFGEVVNVFSFHVFQNIIVEFAFVGVYLRINCLVTVLVDAQDINLRILEMRLGRSPEGPRHLSPVVRM